MEISSVITYTTLLILTLCASLWIFLDGKYKRIINAEGKRAPTPNLLMFLSELVWPRDTMSIVVAKYNKQLGTLYQTFFGLYHCVFVADADAAKLVLLNRERFPRHEEAFREEVFDRMVGRNVVMTDGHEWVRQRKVVSPAFISTENFMPMFREKIQYCVDELLQKQYADTNKWVPVTDIMQQLTIDILGSVAFGFEFDAMKGNISGHLKDYHHVVNDFNMIYMFFPWLSSLFKTQAMKQRIQGVQRIRELVSFVINARREKLQQDHELVQSLVAGNAKGVTLLDIMLASNMSTEEGAYRMSDERLKDNVGIIFIAGHDTTSNALSYAFYCLCAFPDVQEKLYQEIVSTLGTNDVSAEATYEQLIGMNYLTGFIKEVLRLFPPVGVGHRYAANDEVIHGYFIPKGTLVSIDSQAMHYDNKLFPNAEQLLPERWMGNNSNKPTHSHAWLPFAAGPHTCLGNNFSLLEQRMFWTKLLLRFRVEMKPNYKMKQSTALLPKPENLECLLSRRTVSDEKPQQAMT